MAITFPRDFPSTSGLASVRLEYRCVNNRVLSPFTGASKGQETDLDILTADISIPFMDETEAPEWRAWLASLKGSFGTFYLGDPRNPTPRGSVPGSPQVNGASQTGFSLATDGWTASQTNVLRAGDWIQIGTRLYLVVEDADSDGSGESTFEVRPRLRDGGPADNATIITSNPKGLFRLANDTITIFETQGDNMSYGITFSAIEAL